MAESASALGLDEPAIRRLVRGDLIDVPLERLLAVPTLVGLDVEITIVPATDSHGSVAVRGAAG